MERIERIIEFIFKALNIVSMIIVIAMMFLTVIDVMLRYFFLHPIKGSTEITEYFMIFLALGMGWSILKGKSIRVEFIMNRFSPKVKKFIDMLTNSACLIVVVYLTWQSFQESLIDKSNQIRSIILSVPSYPFKVVLSIAFTTVLLALLLRIIKDTTRV